MSPAGAGPELTLAIAASGPMAKSFAVTQIDPPRPAPAVLPDRLAPFCKLSLPPAANREVAGGTHGKCTDPHLAVVQEDIPRAGDHRIGALAAAQRRRMHRGAIGQRYAPIAAQGKDPARTRAIVVGVDLAGVYPEGPGTDEHAAAAGEAAGIADVERGATLDGHRAKARHRQSRGVARVDRHFAGAGGARDVDRAGRCG